MTLLPCRSPGVLLSPLVDQAVAFDLVTETAHHLNATAGTLADLGLVGRPTAHEGPPPPVGCTAEASAGSVHVFVHPVID